MASDQQPCMNPWFKHNKTSGFQRIRLQKDPPKDISPRCKEFGQVLRVATLHEPLVFNSTKTLGFKGLSLCKGPSRSSHQGAKNPPPPYSYQGGTQNAFEGNLCLGLVFIRPHIGRHWTTKGRSCLSACALYCIYSTAQRKEEIKNQAVQQGPLLV